MNLILQLEVAYNGVVSLTRRGLVVLSVEADFSRAKPTVWISPPRANQLEGVETIEKKPDGRTERVMSALVDNCRVQWRKD